MDVSWNMGNSDEILEKECYYESGQILKQVPRESVAFPSSEVLRAASPALIKLDSSRRVE